MRRNRGAAGIDRQTIEQVERYGASRLLDELEADLGQGSYRALPARRVLIPKPGTEERRPLLRAILAELGLRPKQAKTRIVHLREGGEGFDFLGFQHRYVRGRTPRSRHLTFLARWPSRQAMQHARDRVRELTEHPGSAVDGHSRLILRSGLAL